MTEVAVRKLRWPSDAKNYHTKHPRPLYPSDENARRRKRAKGTRPTPLELRTLMIVVMTGRPSAAARELGVDLTVIDQRLKRLRWRVGGTSWHVLVWPLIVQPLQRKVQRLERDLAATKATIELLAEAESQVA